MPQQNDATDPSQARGSTAPQLIIEPARGRVDDSLRIAVTGLAAGQRVRIRASTQDGWLARWAGDILADADEAGEVDLTRHAPAEGGYHGVDPLGPLWSMRPVSGRPEQFFARRLPTPLEVDVEVSVDGETIAEGRFIRDFGNQAVRSRPADGPIVGRLFAPNTGGPHPGVLVLAGSDGGVLEHAASLLASHGYAVLSLAYFGVEGRPKTLDHIDLRYCLDAIDWLGRQPEVASRRVALIGMSRGAELALQLGALSDQVTAVVAGSPAHVRHAGLTSSRTDFTQPAWLLDGRALPFLPGKYTFRAFLQVLPVFLLGRPLRQRAMFERLTADQARVAPAVIEVERVRGPILLLSGSDDQLWPSAWFARQVMARRRAHDRHHDDCHVDYPGAGHFVCFPYGLPSLPPMTRLNPMGRMVIDFGGTSRANAAAASETWQRILDFLGAHLNQADGPAGEQDTADSEAMGRPRPMRGGRDDPADK